MKALLDAMQFKQIMDGVKHAVCTDNSRPILGYIKLDIKGETVTAYALDGFRLAKVVVTNTNLAPNNKDEFTVLIRPITVPKKVVDLGLPIEIEKDGNTVTVTMQTYDGKNVFNYDQPASDFFDAEKVIADAGAHDRELAANGKYVADAMTAISKSTQDRNNLAVIQTKADNCKAFIITGKGEGIEVTQLILPIRRFENN